MWNISGEGGYSSFLLLIEERVQLSAIEYEFLFGLAFVVLGYMTTIFICETSVYIMKGS